MSANEEMRDALLALLTTNVTQFAIRGPQVVALLKDGHKKMGVIIDVQTIKSVRDRKLVPGPKIVIFTFFILGKKTVIEMMASSVKHIGDWFRAHTELRDDGEFDAIRFAASNATQP